MNDANTDYGPFLGGSRVFSGDAVEVAEGPQSTLYGSGAAGGVVSLSAKKGSGAPAGSLSIEGGSFGTVDGTLAAQGASGRWAYNLGAGASHTGNDRPNNAFNGDNLSFRLDGQLGATVAVGATLRGLVERYDDPGDEYTNDPSAHETEKNWLGTLFADVKPGQYVTSHLTLGGQDRRYLGVDPLYGLDTLVVNRRGVIDWQNTIQMTGRNRLVAGLTLEDETTRDTGYGNIDRRQTLSAAYAEDEWTILDDLYLTGGLRRDDFSTFGAATTGRLTAAWLGADRAIKLRGSYGTAFNAPSFLDLYGRDVGYVGNPGLRPERSDGWDAGLDFYVPDSRESLSATWFQTDYRSLIEDNFNVYPFTTENVASARTRGLEIAAKLVLAGIVQAKLAYTRLEADDLTAGRPLLRRPHYAAKADLWADLGRGWSLGGGAAWVGTRADVDAQTYGDVFDPGYSVARAYVAWQATRHLTLKARAENLLNRRYEPVNGYPALGLASFVGAEWKF